MNLNFLKSAFDRIGEQSKQLEQIAASSEKTAAAVTTGGVLYTKVDEIVVLLRQIAVNGMASKKEALKDAKVLGLVGKATEPLGKGFQLIVAALNDLPDADVATKKMDALVGGLVKLGDVGKSILQFAGFMAMAAPLMVIAAIVSPLLLTSLFLITKGLEMLNNRVDLKGAKHFEILGDIGKSILLFGGSLALFGLIGPVAVLGALFASSSILIISGTFKLLEKMKVIDTIEKGTKALTFAALSILSIGASLALFDLVAPDPERILQIGTVIGATALTFGLIGLIGNTIERGAKAMGFAALTIVGIGLALYFFDQLVPGNDILNMQTVKAFVVVGAITAGFLLAGKVAGTIAKGAGAMIVAGIAIIAIAFGINILEDALPKKNTWERIGQYSAIVAGLGVAMALAGASAGLVALGAAQMIVAGIALVVIGAGISVLEKAMPKKNAMERIGQYGAVIGGLGTAMALAGAASPLILLGSAAMLVAGVSVMVIAGGVAVLSSLPTKKLFSKGGLFEDSGQTGFLGGTKTNFEVMMDAIADGVAVNPVTAGAMLLGGKAFITTGNALILIGKGISKFQKIARATDLNTLKTNVNTIITSLSDSFANIGNKYKGGAEAIFTGLNPVAQGISATRGMGQALTGIAVGIQAMAELKFPTKYNKEGNPIEFKSMKSDAPKKVAENTAMITKALAGVFGKIGEKYPGGITSIFTGGSTVAQGISAVQGMGGALAGIATGVQEMANLRFPIGYDKKGQPNKFAEIDDIPEMLDKVNNNLKRILFGEDMSAETEGGLISIFTSVGKPKGTDGSFLKSKRYKDGKEMLQGVGTPIKNLAEGVQAMANMKFPTGFDKDGNPKGFIQINDIGKKIKIVNNNIKKILLGEGVEGSEGLVGIFKKLGGEDNSSWFSSSTIEKGSEIAKMISEPIQSIADAVDKLASSDINAGDISKKIKQFTQALITGNGTDKSLIEAKSNLYQNVGKSYEQIGEAMPDITEGLETSVSAINNMNLEKLTEAKEMFEALATLTHGGGSEDILAQMGNSLENALERLAQMLNNFNQTVEEGNTGQQITLEELNNTLNTLKESVTPVAANTDQSTVTQAPTQNTADMDKVVRAIRDLELMLDSDGIKIRTNPLGT